jgi:hypothetical protein
MMSKLKQMTCRQVCLSSDIPGEHLHKLAAKMERRSKACRFLHPIAAVKTVKAQENMQPYLHVHVSFQSTSSCNLSTVNGANWLSNCMKKKERGRGAAKQLWGIEISGFSSVWTLQSGAPSTSIKSFHKKQSTKELQLLC